jgi:hypothetical protein
MDRIRYVDDHMCINLSFVTCQESGDWNKSRKSAQQTVDNTLVVVYNLQLGQYK